MGATFQILKGDLIGIDVTASGSPLDRHVAEGHPLFHRQRLDGRAGELVGVANAALHTKVANHMQDQILRRHALCKKAIHLNPAHLELVHGQALAGQHIAHLTRADPKGDRPESAMGGGMGITASHRHARLGQAQLRGNHVNDALPAAADVVQRDAVLLAVPFQGAEHLLRQRIGERPLLRGGRHDVVHRGHRALRTTHRQALVLQSREGLRTGDLMDQMQTDKQLGGSAGELRHPMQVPHLVVEGAGTQQFSRKNRRP